MVSGVWGLMPWSPAWLIGLPSGIFALLALRRSDVQSLFGVAIRERNQIVPPAIGLLLGGVLGGLFWIVMGVTLFFEGAHKPFHGPELFFSLLMVVGGAVAGTILIRGAVRLMRMESYQSSVMAA